MEVVSERRFTGWKVYKAAHFLSLSGPALLVFTLPTFVTHPYKHLHSWFHWFFHIKLCIYSVLINSFQFWFKLHVSEPHGFHAVIYQFISACVFFLLLPGTKTIPLPIQLRLCWTSVMIVSRLKVLFCYCSFGNILKTTDILNVSDVFFLLWCVASKAKHNHLHLNITKGGLHQNPPLGKAFKLLSKSSPLLPANHTPSHLCPQGNKRRYCSVSRLFQEQQRHVTALLFPNSSLQ